MAEKYDASGLKRIQWTSHYDVTRCIIENENILLSIPLNIAEDDFTSTDLSTEAAGFKKTKKQKIGTFLVSLLGVLKQANDILQS